MILKRNASDMILPLSLSNDYCHILAVRKEILLLFNDTKIITLMLLFFIPSSARPQHFSLASIFLFVTLFVYASSSAKPFSFLP